MPLAQSFSMKSSVFVLVQSVPWSTNHLSYIYNYDVILQQQSKPAFKQAQLGMKARLVQSTQIHA